MMFGSQLHGPTALPKAKEPPITTGWEAGWTAVRVWVQGQRNKSPKNAGSLSKHNFNVIHISYMFRLPLVAFIRGNPRIQK